MKTLAISVKERKNVGKTSTRALRNQGNVPCVLYGGEKQVTFYAHENDFRKLVYTVDTFLVELDIDGTKTIRNVSSFDIGILNPNHKIDIGTMNNAINFKDLRITINFYTKFFEIINDP